ncbi:glycine betaine ABC transporter substrate-binding protein [Isoptericola halotolerans]|uniref:Glycine betaine/proline transport system substrate-binding protein n=1 Tax=Isoptericola halotolerans TaxID=300560 RepID=A0ABX2A419_9MICO|nr:glycine betaine ABC transporter substrate-binding protein [Isoptericola halotolerans]NOV97600.1 glycine betaine/proline transport system substrate-binding protein [Isoptericola halotolerans]
MSTHRKNHRTRQTAALVATAALGLSLAACSTDDGGDDTGSEGEDMTITLGYLPSWTDGLSSAYLLDKELTAAGYTVEHEEMNEVGVLFTALAEGDIDMYPSAWSDLHSTYLDQYGDDLENVGSYYPSADKFLAVPEYTEVDSLDELADNVDLFDGTITGIEPSAGIMEATTDDVIPAYGLTEAGYMLQESGTSPMITALDEAIANEEDILVTMWTPFWANEEYPLKRLEDPQGAFGESENLEFIATAGFSEQHPEVAEWLGQIDLTESFPELDSMVNDSTDDPAAAVDAWLAEYPDAVPPFEG